MHLSFLVQLHIMSYCEIRTKTFTRSRGLIFSIVDTDLKWVFKAPAFVIGSTNVAITNEFQWWNRRILFSEALKEGPKFLKVSIMQGSVIRFSCYQIIEIWFVHWFPFRWCALTCAWSQIGEREQWRSAVEYAKLVSFHSNLAKPQKFFLYHCLIQLWVSVAQ